MSDTDWSSFRRELDALGTWIAYLDPSRDTIAEQGTTSIQPPREDFGPRATPIRRDVKYYLSELQSDFNLDERKDVEAKVAKLMASDQACVENKRKIYAILSASAVSAAAFEPSKRYPALAAEYGLK
jgi:hypothetical protein